MPALYGEWGTEYRCSCGMAAKPAGGGRRGTPGALPGMGGCSQNWTVPAQALMNGADEQGPPGWEPAAWTARTCRASSVSAIQGSRRFAAPTVRASISRQAVVTRRRVEMKCARGHNADHRTVHNRSGCSLFLFFSLSLSGFFWLPHGSGRTDARG